MYDFLYSPVALAILATLISYTEASMFSIQPKFTLKAEKNKEFKKFCLVDTFNIQSGKIAECLEHCLQDCRCQSFQICRSTTCQLCSRHKENNLRLHENNSCIYVAYEMQGLSEKVTMSVDNYYTIVPYYTITTGQYNL